MPSRIPSARVQLSDVKTGVISREWFRFLFEMFTLTGVGQVVVTATLNFPNTAAGTCSDLTVTVPGARDGDVVSMGVPAGSVPTNGAYFAWVSADDTVTIRFINNTAGAIDPASGDFKVKVVRFQGA